MTPEERFQHHRFVEMAMEEIYNEQVLPSVIQGLLGGGDPVGAGLPQTAATVIVRAQRRLGPPGDIDVMPSLEDVLELLAELSEAAGIHTFTPHEIEAAAFEAMDTYREMRSPRPAWLN